jgi:hypothetical protein
MATRVYEGNLPYTADEQQQTKPSRYWLRRGSAQEHHLPSGYAPKLDLSRKTHQLATDRA